MRAMAELMTPGMNAALVQVLANQTILVTQQGTRAFVVTDATTLRPERLNLPCLPDGAPAPLVDALQGYIDHEVGHLLFTDWSICVDANREGLAELHNIVEDPFVERAMCTRFPGSAWNLGQLHSTFVSEITPTLLREAGQDARRTFGVLLVPATRAFAGQAPFKAFMNAGRYWSLPLMACFVTALGPAAIARMPHLASSAECLAMARLYKEAIGAACGSGSTNGATRGEAARAKADGAVGMPAQSQFPDAKEGGGASHDTATEEPVAPDRVADGGLEATRGDAGEALVATTGDPGSVASTGAEASGRARQGSMAGPDGYLQGDGGDNGAESSAWLDHDGFADALKRAISAQAEDTVRAAPYRILTRDFDVIAPLAVPVDYDGGWLQALDDAVSSTTGVMQRHIQRMMAARTQVSYTSGHRSGRLDASALHRAAVGDDRMFRRRQVALGQDTALSMLVDNSGSMAGADMTLATASAYSLSQCLERVGIPFECLGFTTGCEPEPAMAGAAPGQTPDLTIAYSRTAPLFLPIYKTFAERLTPDVKRRFATAAARQDFLMSNVDGESVAIAAARLGRRREGRRILMVLSDGRPAGGREADLEAHLRETIAAVMRAGMEIVAIGIGDDAVARFYPRFVVIQTIGDLPDVVMGQLRRILTI